MSQSSLTRLAGTDWERIRIPLVLGLLALIPLVIFSEGQSYVARLFILGLIFTTLAMALNIVFGHTDQLFLFVGALTGIGAYTTALSAEAFGISPWITLFFGALLAGVIGALVCYVSARLEFTVILIAILTLALQFAVLSFFVGARDITGGSTGFVFSGFGLESIQESYGIQEDVLLYYLVLAVLGATFLFYEWMRASKYGMAFDAIRQDEVAAESIGVDVVRYKAVAGFISAFIIGLVGPLYAQLEGFVIPGLFEFQVIDVLVLIILIVGGMRTLLGPLVGAAIIMFINEQLATAGQWRTVIFGGLLICLFLYFREGIVPFANRILNDRLTERQGDSQES